MASLPVDRNLLFGIVALQMRFINRVELFDAMQEWVNDKTRTLCQVLLARNTLTDDVSTLIDALVERQLENDDDLAGSLVELSPHDLPGQSTVNGAASRYQVLWAHAKGGLGEIYLAEDTELHRRVALKEIQPRHATNPVSRERFIAEAEITGNLEIPGSFRSTGWELTPMAGRFTRCGSSRVKT